MHAASKPGNFRTSADSFQCHGLLGFGQLRLAGKYLPGIAYWRGITEALTANGVKVIVTTGSYIYG